MASVQQVAERAQVNKLLSILKEAVRSEKQSLKEGITDQIISDWDFPEDVKGIAYSYQIEVENGETRALIIKVAPVKGEKFKISSKLI